MTPGKNDELHENGYWLLPFLTFQADCPYLVGSYAEIGAKLRRFAEMNVSTIILDVVADEQELDHVGKALASSGCILMHFRCRARGCIGIVGIR